jgi:uncharacterized repeat protein (TIGR01451 family)
MKTRLAVSFTLILSVAGSLVPGGCNSSEDSGHAALGWVEPVGSGAQPASAAEGRYGPSTTSQAYPAEGAVRLDMRAPTEVPLNAPFEYTIRVTNTSDVPVSEVVVTERVPRNFRFQGSSPAARTSETSLSWTLDSLGPKATQEIRVAGMAVTPDHLTHCATVAFLIPACADMAVVEPRLTLNQSMPEEVVLCDEIPVNFVVANSGTGSIEDVRVVSTLPAGLKTTEGQAEYAFDAGTLEAGQSKQFSARLKASRTGEYVNRAVAVSPSGLKAEAAAATFVRQPVLAIIKSAPKEWYLGRPITYEITVFNKGDAPATDTVLEDTIPQGVQAVKASSGGNVSGSRVVWQLGTLPVNTSKSVNLTYTPVRQGMLSNTSTASAVCANATTASATSGISGIAAVLLEVIDVADPVEIGGQTTYVITATNQGSIPSTEVQITCTLEDTQQYVSSSGVTRGMAQGRNVQFAPLASLPPKARATWQVVVRAVKPGDVRFTVAMNTAELERPVNETEATQQY